MQVAAPNALHMACARLFLPSLPPNRPYPPPPPPQESTDGSWIEAKESGLVWHYRDADPDFGAWQVRRRGAAAGPLCRARRARPRASRSLMRPHTRPPHPTPTSHRQPPFTPHPPTPQAKELMDHLEDVLSNLPVEVSAGSTIVEIKPQGISKGAVVEGILERMSEAAAAAAASEAASDAAAAAAPPGAAGGEAAAVAAAERAAEQRRVRFAEAPEFVMCIGDDKSDEEMFVAIEQHSAARQEECKVRRPRPRRGLPPAGVPPQTSRKRGQGTAAARASAGPANRAHVAPPPKPASTPATPQPPPARSLPASSARSPPAPPSTSTTTTRCSSCWPRWSASRCRRASTRSRREPPRRGLMAPGSRAGVGPAAKVVGVTLPPCVDSFSVR
jgi:hypothetical protein